MREAIMASMSAKLVVLLCLWFANNVCSLPFHNSAREGRAAIASVGVATEEPDVTFLNRAFLLSRSGASGFVRSPGGIRRLGSDMTTVTASLSTSLEEVHPEGMVLSEDEENLVVLWTNGSSFAYDSTTLEPVRQLWRGFGHYLERPKGRHGAPLQVVYNGERDDSVYIMSGSEYLDVAQVAVSDGRTLKPEESESIDKNGFWRELKYGFSHGGYSYAVSSDCNALFEVRIARFCNSPNAKAFNSWYELQLTCGERTSATSYNHLLLNATLLKTPPTSDASPLLVVTVGVYQMPETRVCSYSLDDINRMMDDTFDKCTSEDGRMDTYCPVWEPNWGSSGHCTDTKDITPCSLSVETPFNGVTGPIQLASKEPLNQNPPLLTLHGATPSATAAAFKGNGSVAIFVGTRDGHVREYKAGSADIQQEWIVKEDTAVVHLAVSEDVSVLYALLNNSVPMVYSLPLINHTHITTGDSTSADIDVQPPTNSEQEVVLTQTVEDEVSLAESLEELNGLSMHWRIRKFLSRLVHLLHAYGKDEQLNNSTEPAHSGGVWRVTLSMFQMTQNKSYLLGKLSTMKARIRKEFNIKWSTVTYADLDEPLHSSLAVVLYLQTLEKGMLQGAARQAEIWAAHFAAEVFGEECHECAAKKFLCVLCEVDNVCVKGVNDCQ